MSSDARKKERKRLKRQQKRRMLRKDSARTPLSRIASEGGQLQCWVNGDYRQMGMAHLLVLGHAPGGRCAMAAFLVDLFCVGLKDAYGQAELTELAFREERLEPFEEQLDAVRIDPAAAKDLVRGGIRFARQNGFKLPKHWDKWASIFGNLGDISSADLSQFGKDGQLLYIGTAQFLRQRLIGSTPEELLSRPDVQWVTPAHEARSLADLYKPGADDADLDEYEEDEGSDEQFEEEIEELRTLANSPQMDRMFAQLQSASDKLAESVRRWCETDQKQPVDGLEDGARVLMLSAIRSAIMGNEQEEARRDFSEGVALLVDSHPEGKREGVIAAVGQISDYLLANNTSKELTKHVGPILADVLQPSSESAEGPADQTAPGQ